MEVSRLYFVLILVSLLRGVMGSADIELMSDRMDILENEMELLSARFEFENRMSTDRGDVVKKQVKNILKIQSDLKSNIRQQITEALSDILTGESIEELIKSEVISEMRHLKRANHQMRRELHQMRTSLGQVEEESMVFRDGLQRGESPDLSSCSKCLVRSEHLTAELADLDQQIKELQEKLKEKNDSCERSPKESFKKIRSFLEFSKCLNSEVLRNKLAKYDHQINELNETLREQIVSSKLRNLSNCDSATMQSPLVSRTPASALSSTPANTSTTPSPRTERSRILVVPYADSARLQMRQFNIFTKSFGIYPHLSLDNYRYAIYVSKINSLLIGLSTARIIISELNTSRAETIKSNVITLGMAADEERGIVFLTTYHPSNTISRMTIRGHNFTTLVNITGNYPYAIAISPTLKIIYACKSDKLLQVFYDGTGLRTLDTGIHIYAVTLDITQGLLYYSKEKKIIKMSLSTGTTTEITGFNFYIWNLIFYEDKVYYSNCCDYPFELGVVNVVGNVVSRTLQTVKVSGVNYYSICLIP